MQRPCLFALIASLAAVAIAADPPKPLTPTEARKKVGDSIVVEMTVKSAKNRLEKRGEIYLDSEADFRDEKNFAAVINRDGAALYEANGIADPAAHFQDKTIRVQGTVSVVDDVPRIEVSNPQQIELVKKP